MLSSYRIAGFLQTNEYLQAGKFVFILAFLMRTVTLDSLLCSFIGGNSYQENTLMRRNKVIQIEYCIK